MSSFPLYLISFILFFLLFFLFPSFASLITLSSVVDFFSFVSLEVLLYYFIPSVNIFPFPTPTTLKLKVFSHWNTVSTTKMLYFSSTCLSPVLYNTRFKILGLFFLSQRRSPLECFYPFSPLCSRLLSEFLFQCDHFALRPHRAFSQHVTSQPVPIQSCVTVRGECV